MKINKWEIIGYLSLLLSIVGQILTAWLYLIAQGIFLIANILSIVKDFKQDLPLSNKLKDICFTGITIALIIIWTCYY